MGRHGGSLGLPKTLAAERKDGFGVNERGGHLLYRIQPDSRLNDRLLFSCSRILQDFLHRILQRRANTSTGSNQSSSSPRTASEAVRDEKARSETRGTGYLLVRGRSGHTAQIHQPSVSFG